MLFNSLSFLVFFPVVTLIYFLLPHKYRWIHLLVSSYYFYMCWNAAYALLIAFSTLVTYASGTAIDRANRMSVKERRERVKKLIVAASFLINLGILVYFKYSNFILDNLTRAFAVLNIRLHVPQVDVLLPVGISFYTFQALGYTMDVYRGTIRPIANPGKYALFVSFYPQLVAGPIERSDNLIRQFDERHTFDLRRVSMGLLLMGYGLFQEMIVADRVAVAVNAVWADTASYGSGAILLATLLFSVQIYCDFAGYSNIAAGAAQVMGFKLMDNFRQPSFARSIKEFWHRWHISLSTWFRDYLYIPLGGSRKGKLRTQINLMITFLVSGVWHGAAWTYIIWGGVHGIFQIIGGMTQPLRERLKGALGIRKDSWLDHAVRMLTTFALVNFTWILFRANSVRGALNICRRILAFNDMIPSMQMLKHMGLDKMEWMVALISVIVLIAADWLQTKTCVREWIVSRPLLIRWAVYLIVIVSLIVWGVYGPGYDASQFIYFQF